MKTRWSTLITNISLNSHYISRAMSHNFGLVIYAKGKASKSNADFPKANANKIGLKAKAKD